MSKKIPKKCKALQPWKNDNDPTAPPNMEVEIELLEDLSGCIIDYWNKYKGNTEYSKEHAFSDAYCGMIKAIEHDRAAPKITKNVICDSCGNKFKPYCPGDEIADHIYNVAPKNRIPLKRTIMYRCPGCGHEHVTVIRKSQFASCANNYIRGSIQSGIRGHRRKHPSIDSVFGENIMHSSRDYKKEDIPLELTNAIHSIVGDFQDRHKSIIAMYFGFGGNEISDKIIQKQVKCKDCGHTHDATINYQLRYNYSLCPNCGTENEVDMKMKQSEIADELGITKQRIGVIINKIKEAFEDQLKPLIIKYGLQF